MQLGGPGVAGDVAVSDHGDVGALEDLGELAGEGSGSLRVRGRDETGGLGVLDVLLPLEQPDTGAGLDRLQHFGVPVQDRHEVIGLLRDHAAVRAEEPLLEPLAGLAVDGGRLADDLLDEGALGVEVRVGRDPLPLRALELVDVGGRLVGQARRELRCCGEPHLRLAAGLALSALRQRGVEQILDAEADRRGDLADVGVAGEAVQQHLLVGAVVLHRQGAVAVAVHGAQSHELVATARLRLVAVDVESVPDAVERAARGLRGRDQGHEHPPARGARRRMLGISVSETEKRRIWATIDVRTSFQVRETPLAGSNSRSRTGRLPQQGSNHTLRKSLGLPTGRLSSF